MLTLHYYNQVKTLLEWLSITKIAVLFSAWILIFSLADWTISNNSNESYLASADGRAKSFSDSLYFSVVTATTLGYGDETPKGLLRLSAAVEVLGGLVLAGLAVSVVAATPMRLTRLALSACAGTWIERARFTEDQKSVFYALTEVTFNGNSLFVFGENFDNSPHTHGSTYRGHLIANQFPTLIFTYSADAGMKEYTDGIYKIEMRVEPSGVCKEFYGESYDAKHGRRDRVHSLKILDFVSLRKLRDPSLRLEEMRRLVRELYHEEPPF